jgi:hypothetical protein
MIRRIQTMREREMNSRFELASIFSNELLEHSILVPKTVTPERDLAGGTRIDVAGGQTTKTSITQSGVTFGMDDVFEGEAELVETFGKLAFEA